MANAGSKVASLKMLYGVQIEHVLFGRCGFAGDDTPYYDRPPLDKVYRIAYLRGLREGSSFDADAQPAIPPVPPEFDEPPYDHVWCQGFSFGASIGWGMRKLVLEKIDFEIESGRLHL